MPLSTLPSTQTSIGLTTMSPAMAEAKNYYRWIADQLAPAVGQRVLDVGGGMGSLLSYFLDREALYALDISPECVAYLENIYRNQPNLETILGDVTDPELQVKLKTLGVDTILCTNVLEHVEDDLQMLQAFHQVLKPVNGRLALLVPAHQFLYGTMDTLAGHYRRYNRQEVQNKLIKAGFRVEGIRYMNSLATLGWWLNGRVIRQKELKDKGMNTQILYYDRFGVPMNRWIESWLSLPFGLSVIALAEAV
jgi:2-polyprenyl-3-methyl-5-hydroxy-6-metoxy-1,4-benzoquinol methylase